MRGAQTLGDAMRASLVIEEDRPLSKAPAPVLFQRDLAAAQLERRSISMGMSNQMIDRAIERGFAMVATAEGWCDTPIEKRLLPWLIFADYGDRFMSVPAGVHNPKLQQMLPLDDILIIPQFAFVRYRFDFAVMARVEGRMGIVAVECDGDAYHYEAADSLRDEYLSGFGIATVRITGKEIAAHPGGAVGRVVDAVITSIGG